MVKIAKNPKHAIKITMSTVRRNFMLDTLPVSEATVVELESDAVVLSDIFITVPLTPGP